MMTKDEMKKAFSEALAEEYDEILEKRDVEPVIVTDEFEERMERLFRKDRNPFRRLFDTPVKKAVLTFAAVLTAALALYFLPGVLRPAPQEQNYYEISILPEGYREESRTLEGSSLKIECANAEKDRIIFEQTRFDPNSENEALKELLKEGQTISFSVHEYHCFLIWIEDDTVFTLTNYGTLSAEKFLEAAASIKKTG